MQKNSDLFSLWSLPQPIIVLGLSLLTASAAINGWADLSLLVPLFLFAPIPLLLLAERLLPKRKDWLLNWKDLAEDLFWLVGTFLIWAPIYDQAYDTPISNLFESVREASGFPFRLEAATPGGLLIAALIGVFAAE